MPTIEMSDKFYANNTINPNLTANTNSFLTRFAMMAIPADPPNNANNCIGLFHPSYYASLKLMKGTVPTDFTGLDLGSSDANSLSYPRESDTLVWWGYDADPYTPDTYSVVDATANPISIRWTPKRAKRSGVATWFWINISDLPHSIIGTVGTIGSGADFEMTSTSIVAGKNYEVLDFKLNIPSSWTYT